MSRTPRHLITAGKRDDDTDASLRPHPRAAKAIIVFLTFVFAGPPIAALIFIGLWPLFEPGRPISANVEDLIDGALRLTIAAYVFVGAQMAAIGLAAALWSSWARRRCVPVVLVLAMSFVTAAIAIFVLAKPMSMPASHPGIVAAAFVLHLGAALGCWLIANALLRMLEWRGSSYVKNISQSE